MMRRQYFAVSAASARGITSYNYTAPDLATSAVLDSHFPKRSEAVSGPVRVSKLPNGTRVITHDRQGIQVSIGTYIESGAKFDPLTAPGLNYVMRWSMSASNMDNSLFQIDRNARAVGAAREHNEVRKRFLGFKIEAPAGRWERVAQDLFTSLAAPRFPEWDTERFRDTMDNLLEEQRWNNPREYAVDQLETVAFFREPLGNPRMVPPELNGSCTHGNLLAQWAKYCLPSRVVIAGVNVDHDALVAAYENCEFPHRDSAPHHAGSPKIVESKATEVSQYQPGSERVEQEARGKAMATKPDMDEECIAAIGFPTHGHDSSVKTYAAALVARQLASISFGESLIINRDAPHHGIEAFYRPYSTVGLIGATIRSTPAESKAATIDAVKQLRGLPTDGDAIKRAAARASAQFVSDNLDVARDYCDFLGTSLIANTMNRVSSDEILTAVSKIDTADIKNIVDSFNNTRPSLFATGEVLYLPSLRQMGL